jgi:hypothetical protein
MYGDFFGGRVDELEKKGRQVTSRASSKADELLNRQKDMSARKICPPGFMSAQMHCRGQTMPCGRCSLCWTILSITGCRL